MENRKDIDLLDIITIIFGAIIIAIHVGNDGSLIIGFPVMLLGFVQHIFRRSSIWLDWIDHITGNAHPTVQTLVREIALPAPKDETSLVVRQDKPMDINIVGMPDQRTLFQRMVNPTVDVSNGESLLTTVMEKNNAAKQQTNMITGIKRLPVYYPYTQLAIAPAKMAVPIGIDSLTKELLWADFGNDLDVKILHALVAGYTGSGKDALLRLWFSMLTTHNTPDDLRFVIVDGKVDWLSPALAESAYMAIPPTGGVDIQKQNGKYIDCAKEDMEKSFEWMFEEIQRRQKAFSAIGAVDMLSYRKKSGKKLPYLFFIASDIGETFDGNLKMLTNLLIMKGRAYGVRLIISLQNPVGEATKWRSQIGLIMTGHQPIPDHDRYVLGIPVGQMQYRPSMLPNPEETEIARGLFIVRRGSSQHLVRTPHLPEEQWFEYIEQVMKTKHDYHNDILGSLLTKPVERSTRPMIAAPVKQTTTQITKLLLTREQVDTIIQLTQKGINKTEIMIKYLKATNPERYKELSPVVSMLIKKTQEKMNEP